jgi:hypothetical protein
MNKAQPHLTAMRTKSCHAAVLNSRGTSVRSEIILIKRSDKLTLVIDLYLLILRHPASRLIIKPCERRPLVLAEADLRPSMRVDGDAELVVQAIHVVSTGPAEGEVVLAAIAWVRLPQCNHHSQVAVELIPPALNHPIGSVDNSLLMSDFCLKQANSSNNGASNR